MGVDDPHLIPAIASASIYTVVSAKITLEKCQNKPSFTRPRSLRLNHILPSPSPLISSAYLSVTSLFFIGPRPPFPFA